MKKLFFSVGLMLFGLIAIGAFTRKKIRNVNLVNVATESGVDVLESVRKVNGSTMPQPPVRFRSGHVSSKSHAARLTKTKDGFVIQLPSSNNVPTPSIRDGKVFVSGGFGSKEYFAFDAKTGATKWAVSLDDDGPSSAVIEDGVIVYNTESCTLFACEAESGKQLWSYYLGDPLMSMPAISNGRVFTAYPCTANAEATMEVKEEGKTVYTMKYTHVLAAFDLKTGKILWQKWIDGDIMSAPIAEGENLYITTFPGTVYKFNQSDGNILSAKYLRATSAPVIKDGEMTVSRRTDEDGKVMESIAHGNASEMKVEKQHNRKEAHYLSKDVQLKSRLKSEANQDDAGNGFSGGAPSSAGAKAAENNIGQGNVSSLQSFQGSRTLSYKEDNFNTMGDEIVCTDSKDGQVKWKSKLSGDMHKEGGFLATPPLAAGGKIVVATYAGEVQIRNAGSGAVETSYSTGEPVRYQPIVEEGWIYVTTTTGKMVAINTGNPQLTGWPMWGKDAGHTNVEH